jgi:hypothetical protein
MTFRTDLKQLIHSKLWHQLTKEYTPQEIVQSLSFRDALRVAYRLLYNRGWDDELQNYATQLFEAIRVRHAIEWNQSWKYDAFLGLAYYHTCEHEKRYEAYKRAFDRVETPPPQLLIEMARCADCPGSPPIDRKIAIALVKKALQQGAYIDGIGVMRTLYSAIGDKKQEAYWAKVLENADKKLLSPSIEPEFLGKEYFRKEGDPKGSDTIEKSSIFFEDDPK